MINIDKFKNLEGSDLVKSVVDSYGDKVALLSAFNPEDVIISFWLGKINPTTPILFLDTLKHFPETLNYVDKIINKFALKNVKFLQPDSKLIANNDTKGDLWLSQVNRCCWLRKVEPMERAIKDNGCEALITGRRKQQTSDRSNVSTIEVTEDNKIKFNPLINWDKKMRDDYMKEHNIEHHPLYNLGYLSIGCAPCTTPVYLGEDERAGRWRHTRLNQKDNGKTECGLHVVIEENK